MNDHILHLENGRLAAGNDRGDVDRIARKAAAHAGAGGIVVHFHGGLVKEARGREIAERLLPIYRAAGAYPIFLVWETGLFETLRNNLGEIAREKLFQRIWKRVEEFVKRKFAQGDGERAAGVLPQINTLPVHGAIDAALAAESSAPLEATEEAPPEGLSELTDAERLALEQELQLDVVLLQETQKASNGLRDPAEVAGEVRERSTMVRGSTTTLMDPDALDRLVDRPQPGARGLISGFKMAKAVVEITARVVKRFVRGRDHGLHATVVEEILRALYIANAGQLVWSTIKKDTTDSFGGDGQVHGGTALLQALGAALDPQDPPRITLVGHSTGAIYISEWLDAAAGVLPAAIRHGVVYLAPASTFDLSAVTLARHAARLEGFRMFTMTDENERKNRLIPVVYPHSLLYFVSGVVEGEADTPIVGMERYFDAERYSVQDFPAVEAVRRFVAADGGRAVWSVTEQGPAGRLSGSLKHGDFDNDAVTLKSVAHILEKGFGA